MVRMLKRMDIKGASLLLLLSGALPVRAAEVSCPPEIQVSGTWHSLNNASMFDGPPAELASQVPVNGVWDTRIEDSATGKYYLVCEYAGTSSKTSIPITAQITACEFGGTQKNPQVTCR
jgi:hypothetical protein